MLNVHEYFLSYKNSTNFANCAGLLSRPFRGFWGLILPSRRDKARHHGGHDFSAKECGATYASHTFSFQSATRSSYPLAAYAAPMSLYVTTQRRAGIMVTVFCAFYEHLQIGYDIDFQTH